MLVEWIYLVILIAISSFSLLLFGLIWLRPKTVTVCWFLTLIGLLTFLILSYVFFSISEGEEAIFLWVRLRFVPLSLVPIVFLVFIVSYTGRDYWLKPVSLFSLFIIPFITLFIIWFVPDLFWQSWSYSSSHVINLEAPQYTGWFWIHMIWSIGTTIIASVLLIRHAVDTPQFSKRQIRSIVIGMLIVSVCIMFPTLGLTQDLPNPFPISLATLIGLMFWALFKQGLLKLYPVAYHTILENIMDAIFVLDEKNYLIHLNSTALDIIHPYKLEQVIGKHAKDVLRKAPQEVEQYANHWNAQFELTVKTNNQAVTYDIHISPIFDGIGKQQYKLVTMRDITPYKKIEEALRQSENQYRMLAEHSTDAITLHIPHQHYTYVNPAMQKLTGYSHQELIAMTEQDAMNAIHPDDVSVVQQAYQKQSPDGKNVTKVQYRYQRKNNDYVWVENHTVPILNKHNEIDQVLMTTRDITDRKLAQEREFILELERERMLLLSEFIENSAHEYRTPLSVIGTSLYFIEKSPDPAVILSNVAKIQQQINRMARLVDMSLTMAKLERLQELNAVNIHLRTILEGICDELRHKYGETPALHCTITKDLPVIHGDPKFLVEAFRQLLENAFRYTPANGEITVGADTDEEGTWVEFRDTGIGISDDALPHIFETFWRQDNAHSTPGLGLGLPIAKRIIERHGGQLSIKSEINQGSTFRIVFKNTMSLN